MTVIDITARLPQTVSPLDLEEGVLDAMTIAAVDEVEQVVQAMARTVAIELVRRGRARLDLTEYLCPDGTVYSVNVAEA